MKKIMSVFILAMSILTLCQNYVLAVSGFSDVPTEHWASKYITQMVNDGVVSGYPDGTFAPNKPVTRAEFCKIAVTAADKAMPPLNELRTAYYAISGIEGHWSEQYMQTMAKYTWQYREWFLSDNTNPDQIINRGEAAMGIADLLYGYPRSYSAKEDEILRYLQERYLDSESFGGFQATVYEATIKEFMTGYDDGCFYVGNPVTRAELCAILYKISDGLKDTTQIINAGNGDFHRGLFSLNEESQPQPDYDAYKQEHDVLIEWAENKIQGIYDEADDIYNETLNSAYAQYGIPSNTTGSIDSFSAANAQRQRAALRPYAEKTAETAKQSYIADQMDLLATFVQKQENELKKKYGIN